MCSNIEMCECWYFCLPLFLALALAYSLAKNNCTKLKIVCIYLPVLVHSAVICRKVNVYISYKNRYIRYLHRIFYSMDIDKSTSIHNNLFELTHYWTEQCLHYFRKFSGCCYCCCGCSSLRIRQCRKLHEFCICSPQKKNHHHQTNKIYESKTNILNYSQKGR